MLFLVHYAIVSTLWFWIHCLLMMLSTVGDAKNKKIDMYISDKLVDFSYSIDVCSLIAF